MPAGVVDLSGPLLCLDSTTTRPEPAPVRTGTHAGPASATDDADLPRTTGACAPALGHIASHHGDC
jgi:hypothetical protein